MHTEFWLEQLEHLKDQGKDGIINIKMDLKRQGWGCGLDLSVTGQGLVVGSCSHRNEPSGSIKGWEFLH
jgi:hypothetical protein